MLGMGRALVFSQTVGSGCLGSAYVTAYQVPNLITELLLGGALTSALVPVLARSAERADIDPAEKSRVAQISSASLTWVVLIGVPTTLALAAVAGPVASALLPSNPNAHCVRSDVVAAAGGFLAAFAPQIMLYGLSVVLVGLLQAYRRFTGPALAPLVTTGVLLLTYIVFGMTGVRHDLGATPAGAMAILSVGTTLSIAASVAVCVPPVWRLRLRLRPTLKLPRDLGRFAGGMALVGLIEFIASDLATVVVIVLANGHGDTGALVIYNYAWLVFNAMYAVLGLSIVTSAFPVLSANDGDKLDRTCAGSTRAVTLMSWLGTAVMSAIAIPAAHVLSKQPGQVTELAQGFWLFAPGITGFVIVTNLSRLMFALRKLKVAAVALAGSWLLIMAADAIMVPLVPSRYVVPALALGSTIGQTLTAIPMIIATRRIRGAAAIAGLGRAMVAGIAAAAAGGMTGVVASVLLPAHGKLLYAAAAVLAAGSAVVVFAVFAWLLDKSDLAPLLNRARSSLPAGIPLPGRKRSW
jgi:putative peptidoglycan lipid II flippase